ncbi:Ig-like domain-containing protein, partial [Halomonas halmophila]|uniref:Ig-like domain-containing protein n=1 Tax=Halomonas halmophila TaxID=252 RepID=UPI001144E0F6
MSDEFERDQSVTPSEPQDRHEAYDADFLALEERIMFDGAMGAEAADAAAEQADDEPAAPADPADSEALAEAVAAAPPDRSEIYFIDGGVDQRDNLMAEVPDGAEVVVLDSESDGVEQIQTALQGRSDLDAIHLLSHGDTGQVQLGNTTLDAESINGEHAQALTAIGASLADTGDILVYGCDFGQDESTLTALSSATGADVAASTDDTGHADLGGDWELESRVGNIETPAVSLSDWQGVLAPEPELDLDTTTNNTTQVASDDFQSGGLSGGSGWSGDWEFVDLGGGGQAADVAVESKAGSQALFIEDDGIGVQRSLDLSGAYGATLNFDYLRDVFDTTSDTVELQISTDGNSFTTLQTYEGPGADSDYQSTSVDISAFISDSTTIRFATADNAEFTDDDEFYIDNVTVDRQEPYTTLALTGGGSVAVTSPDVGIVDDGTTLESATITLSNPQTGDALSIIDALPTGITASSYDSGTGTLTLTGSATLADYESALASVGFSATSGLGIDRVVNVAVNDGANDSRPATSVISVDTDTDEDGVRNAMDIDDDNDGILDTNEQGDVITETSGLTTAFEPMISAGFADGTYDVGNPGEYQFSTTNASALDGRLDTFDPGTQGSDDGIGLNGDSTGSLTLDYTNPVTDLSFALSEFEAAFEEATIDVYDTDGNRLDASNYIAQIGDPIEFFGNNTWAGPATDSGADDQDLFGQIQFDFGSLSIDRVEVSWDIIDDYSLRLIEPIFTAQEVTSGPPDADGDGRNDDVDIDSDDDGITDNVEAQSTSAYIAPSGKGTGIIDVDGDGLDDNYDQDIGDTSAVASVGLSPVDTDNDGTPDVKDADSDGHGLGDVLERGDGQGSSLAGSDSDNDGLDDNFEGADINDGFDVNDENLDATDTTFNLADVDNDVAADGSDATPLTNDFSYRDVNNDPDNDGIVNANDIDDDNDGILDINEQNTSSTSVTTDTNIIEVVNSAGTTTTDIDLSSLGFQVGDTVDISDVVADGDLNESGETFVLDFNDGEFQTSELATGEQNSGTLEPVSPAVNQTINVIDLGGGVAGIRVFTNALSAVNSLDGNPALQHRFTISGQATAYNDRDSDGDGIPDRLDIDSDNDGITDNVEAQNTADYIAPSGTGSGITDADGDGLDDAYDADTGNARPAASAGLTPVDTDGDDTVDVLDADSDNDGQSDIEERNDGQGSSLANADSDIDGLDDNFEGADSNDGFDVNDENIDASGNLALADTDNDTAADGADAVPLINDLDYRDANLPPNAVDDSLSVDEDQTLNASIIANDNDPENDPLNIVSASIDTDDDGTQEALSLGSQTSITVGGNTIGSLTLTAAGALSFTPAADYNGTVPTLSYTLSDGNNQTDTADITITVNAVDDAVDDNATTDEDTAVTSDVLGNDSFEGSPTVSGVTQGTNGSVTNNGDGTVTYTPDADFHGTDSYTYTVTSGGVTETATVNVTVNPVNDPASFGGDTAGSGDEDTTLTGTLTVSDNADGMSNPDFSIETGDEPANGTASIDAGTGEWTYTPNADYHGDDSFTVSVTDDDGNTETQTIDVTVSPVADIVNDSATTDEDTAVTTDVLTNDNFDSPDAEVTAVTQGTNGSVTNNGDGTVTYTPNADFNGTDSYTYTVTSGGVTETATVNVTVNAVDDGVVDSFTTNEDTPLDADVSTNDTFSAAATYSLSADASNGTVSMNSDGTFTYTPDADYNGGDGFSYDVTGVNGDTETVTVDLTVDPVADTMDDTATTDEDTAVTTNVLANDSFAGTPSVTGITQGTNGTVTNNGDGTVTYTPDADFNGTDSYTYTVTSGGVTETATVNVTVNPVADGVADSFTTPEDTPLNDDVSANDTFSAAASYELNTDASNGTVAMNPDGTFTYTPDADYNGSDSFSYDVTDVNVDTETVTVDLTVAPVNDAPVGVDDSLAVTEDTSVTQNVLGNDIDTEGDPLTISSAQIDTDGDGTPGSLTLGNTTPLTDGAGNPIGDITVDSNGDVTFTPASNYAGPVPELTYTPNDGTDDGTPASVSIGPVAPVNDAPVSTALNDRSSNDSDTINLDVSGNFSDPDDGDVLTFSASELPDGLTMDASGTISGTIDSSASQNGPYAVTVSATDAEGETTSQGFTWSVANPMPVAADDSYTTDEETPLTIAVPGVVGNDSDADGDDLSVALASGPTNGSVTLDADGSLTYTPDSDFNGTDTFTYILTDADGATNTATVTINVGAVNDAPTGTDDSILVTEDTSVTQNVLGNDNDPEGDPLTIASAEIDTDGDGTPDALTLGTPTEITGGAGDPIGEITVDSDGEVTFTPAADYIGLVPDLSYTPNDGTTDGTSATVGFGPITPVNDAPVAGDDSFTVAEDGSTSVPVLGNDSDVDGDSLSITSIDGQAATAGTPISLADGSGTVTLEADGSITFTAAPDYTGPATFDYQITDGTATASATVNGTVTAVNDPPVAVNDSFTVAEDGSTSVAVLGNDSDVDGDPLSVTAIDGQAVTAGVPVTLADGSGTATLQADGSITFTPAANYNGPASFDYRITDGNTTATATVSGNVTSVNDAPDAVEDTIPVTEDTPVTDNVLTNDTDPEGNPLSVDSAAIDQD